jgi:predicted ATPase
VNLFIGPNNSGKSNFLKGTELFLRTLQSYPWGEELKDEEFAANIFRASEPVNLRDKSISFFAEATIPQDELIYQIPIVYKDTANKNENQRARYGTGNEWKGINRQILQDYAVQKRIAVVYKPDPSKFQIPAQITNETRVSADAGNLVSFIFFLSQNYKSRFRQLENDLAQCIGNLVAISTPVANISPNDSKEQGKLKLKLFDKNDIGYWADEVSEGVLYFLALLCIIHQPDPPKLLLLEEPEKGIHPRRIKEVMDFIFELARLRDIQIILTSHSPYVVDHFKDIPECISVFDRENGETVIRNAGDIIKQTNAEYAAQGLPPTEYTDSLGEYWVSGFLGGVPL